MHWLWLTGAIVFEVCGTTCMKLSVGFTRPWPSFGMAVFYITSFICINMALRKLEVGIAYSIWGGVGTALIAGVGIYFFRESVSTMKLAGVALIILGVVLLKLADQSLGKESALERAEISEGVTVDK